MVKKEKQSNAEYLKEYYEKNKEKIKEYGSSPVNCICGCKISRTNYTRHLRSAKHKQIVSFLKSKKK